MRLTVVGCSGSFPGPDSPASCYLVEAAGYCVVLDLGNGSLGALSRHVPIFEVDAVLLSHLHADHCMDLCSYYVARRYRPEGALPPIPVLGPSGTAARMARAYDIGEDPGMSKQFDFVRYPEHAFELGPLRVRVQRVVHPVETYAVRVEHGGRALAYSGDTAPSDALVELARGVDVLVAEASFHDGEQHEPGLHMTGREAGEHAARAGVGRLVVTHVPPWNDAERTLAEAATAYDGPAALARSGLVVHV